MNSNRRLNSFRALTEHPMLGKDMKKLNAKEQGHLESIILDNAHLDSDKWAETINRLDFKGSPIRIGNQTRAWALLLEASTKERFEAKKARSQS